MSFTETRIVTRRLHERPDDSWTIDGALAAGAYKVFQGVLDRGDPAAIQAEVSASGLRGRGGANFNTGQKWSFLPKDSFPRYLVVNGDEGEPSTFKDRLLIERDPHQLIEGIAIAAYAIQCNLAFIYCRGEFALGYDRLVRAIADAKAKGFLGANINGSGFDLEIVVHRGAGAYICSEETALFNSL
jgi:NADH-quinone oxidoreductase subunit F